MESGDFPFPILKHRSQQLSGTLSGSEQQMLATARALMGRAGLLLLDEPSMGLAPLIFREIFSVINSQALMFSFLTLKRPSTIFQFLIQKPKTHPPI